MLPKDSPTGIAHLGKTALPLIGRIGTIAGGIVSLLAIFERISGDIFATLGGFLLVAAGIASAVVVFHKTNRVVDEIITVQAYSYSKRARVTAAIVMSIAGILFILFAFRITLNVLQQSPAHPSPIAARQTPRLPVTSPGAGKTNAPTVPPTLPPTTALPTAPPTSTFTPAPPTRTLTVTPFPIDQMTDVTGLLKLGNDALAAKNYSQAVSSFSRAMQIDATNAQAQFGLGQAHFYQNNPNAAFSPLRTALQLNPALNEAHAFLGYVYDYRLDYARARAEYEEFLRVAPRDHALRTDITDRLKRLTGNGPYPTLTPRSTFVPTMPPPLTITPTLAITK